MCCWARVDIFCGVTLSVHWLCVLNEERGKEILANVVGGVRLEGAVGWRSVCCFVFDASSFSYQFCVINGQ